MKKVNMALALLIILAAGCKKKEEPPQNAQPVQQTAQSTAAETPKAYPNYTKTPFYFQVSALKGGMIDLKDYSGKPVIVMFFTETCPYCRKAAPFINSIYQKYSSRGLSVIAISIKDESEGVKRFRDSFNLKFDLGYNGGTTSRKYGIQGVPFIYLLDKNHDLIRTWPGYDESYNGEIDSEVKKAL